MQKTQYCFKNALKVYFSKGNIEKYIYYVNKFKDELIFWTRPFKNLDLYYGTGGIYFNNIVITFVLLV